MQTYDWLMLIVLAGTTLFGFVKGLAWQLAYVASLVLSYLSAIRFGPQLAPLFGHTEPFNRFAAMLAAYVLTSLVIWMVFRVVAGAIDRVKLREFDRQMGALIGFARGVLWCIAITFFAATLLESQRDMILNSRSGHYIALLLDKSHTVLPPEVHRVVQPYVDRIEQGLDPNRPAGGMESMLPWQSPSAAAGVASPWPGQPAAMPQPVPGGAAPAPWPSQPGQPSGGGTAQPTPWPSR